MSEWNMQPTDKYEKDYRWYEKKRPEELKAVLANLDSYFDTLIILGNPLQVAGGYIHDEPMGIKALDQKGGQKKTKLEQTRLYVYPCVENRTLYLLRIGNKTDQKGDISACREFVTQIRGI